MHRRFIFTSWQITIPVIAILLILARQFYMIKVAWMNASGYEQEWVAGSLLGGYGYSFDPATAWLGPYGTGTEYTPTAWVEPLYTLIIFACKKIFGGYGRLILVLLNILWLVGSSFLIFLLVREVRNPKTGLFTALLFFLVQSHKSEVILYIGNAALAGFLYCLIYYMLLICLETKSIRSCIFLGIIIGLTNLNQAGSLLFAFFIALILLLKGGIRKGSAWRKSFIVLITTGFVLLPWIARNYIAFNAFVPVRSGFGYQLYIGNPGLARTITPLVEFEKENTEPPWTASTPLQALRFLRYLEYDGALASHSMDFVRINSPVDYRGYNEVRRDKVFLSRSLTFILKQPLLTVQMLFWKAITFLAFWDWGLTLISLTAIIGGILMLRDIRVTAILILVLSYMIPYITSLPLYYRYRSPIEPMLFVLAAIFMDVCLQKYTQMVSDRKRLNVIKRTTNYDGFKGFFHGYENLSPPCTPISVT